MSSLFSQVVQPALHQNSSDQDAAWSQRNAKARATALVKRLAAKTTLIDQTIPSDVEDVDPSIPSAPVPPTPVPHTLKCPTLDAITNQPSKHAVQQSASVPLASVSEVSASFWPAYQTCTTRTRIQDIGGENAPVVEPRQSGCFLK